MSFTATLNGSLGRASTTFSRQVLARIGVASKESGYEAYSKVFARKNALDETPDTVMPIPISLGPIVLATTLVIRVVNSALVKITFAHDPGTGEVPEPQHLVLGTPDHPEGLYVFFGEKKLEAISVEEVYADRTEVEVWITGNGV